MEQKVVYIQNPKVGIFKRIKKRLSYLRKIPKLLKEYHQYVYQVGAVFGQLNIMKVTPGIPEKLIDLAQQEVFTIAHGMTSIILQVLRDEYGFNLFDVRINDVKTKFSEKWLKYCETNKEVVNKYKKEAEKIMKRNTDYIS